MTVPMSKQNCYPDNFYLAEDINNLSDLLEYSDIISERLLNVTVSRTRFAESFMVSELRGVMEMGHPRIITQASTDTFELFYKVDMDNDLTELLVPHEWDNSYRDKELYWIGGMYAYIHYKTRLNSRELYNIMPLSLMRDIYVTGHQMSMSRTYEKLAEPVLNQVNF